MALADERAADEKEIREREIVLELADALHLVVGAALVAVAQIVAAQGPVGGDFGALLRRHHEHRRLRNN